jgi:hypothetical protein
MWSIVLALVAAAIAVGVVPAARRRMLAVFPHPAPAAMPPAISALAAPSAPKLDPVPAESTIADLSPAPSAASSMTASASSKPAPPPKKSTHRAPR